MKPEDVPQELVDIFAHVFWPFPFGQHEEPQAAARQALAPVLVEHEKQLRAERNALKTAIAEVRRLCDLTIAASCRVQAIDQARDTLAVLDRALAAPEATTEEKTDEH